MMSSMEYGGGLFNLNANEAFLSDGRTSFLKPDWQLFRSGRDALRAFAELAKGRADTILMPALCCESMLLPFSQSGYRIIFYRLNENLTADTADVLSKLTNRCVLLYMPYLGTTPFDTAFLAELRARNILLLEDRTQDIIVPRPADSFIPDACVASLRKWAALPGGGMLCSSLGHTENIVSTQYSDMCMDAMRLKEEYLSCADPAPEQKVYFLKEFHDAEELLDEASLPVAMSADCYERISRIDFNKLWLSRRANVLRLREDLKPLIDSGRIALMNDTPENSTLYLPILLDKRNEVQRELAARNIYCPIIWHIPPEALGVCDISERSSMRMLALPCDQRYTPEDMSHIASELIKIMENYNAD